MLCKLFFDKNFNIVDFVICCLNPKSGKYNQNTLQIRIYIPPEHTKPELFLSLLSGLFYARKYDFDFLETGLIYWNRDCKRTLELRAS